MSRNLDDPRWRVNMIALDLPDVEWPVESRDGVFWYERETLARLDPFNFLNRAILDRMNLLHTVVTHDMQTGTIRYREPRHSRNGPGALITSYLRYHRPAQQTFDLLYDDHFLSTLTFSGEHDHEARQPPPQPLP